MLTTVVTVVKGKNGKINTKTKKYRQARELAIANNLKDVDFWCERGGRGNHHAGNLWLHHEKEKFVDRYGNATDNQKTAISKALAQKVISRGGKFKTLIKETQGSLQVAFSVQEVPFKLAREKMGQILRDAVKAKKEESKGVTKNKKKKDQKRVKKPLPPPSSPTTVMDFPVVLPEDPIKKAAVMVPCLEETDKNTIPRPAETKVFDDWMKENFPECDTGSLDDYLQENPVAELGAPLDLLDEEPNIMDSLLEELKQKQVEIDASSTRTESTLASI